MDEEGLVGWYATMVLIRRFEEAIGRLFAEGRAPGTTHLSIGQEACAVGAMAALYPDDQVFSTHRGHGHFLAKGGDPALLMSELLGRAPGYCRGFGGSQHASHPPIGFIGTNGVTGGNIAIATGAALANLRLNTGRVVVSFFGDGACNQGLFHESLNMASLWSLPVVYFIENNLYAQWTHISRSTSETDLSTRAAAYGMRGVAVDGMDPLAVSAVTGVAVANARKGKGPTLIEARTYRFGGHSKSDIKTAVYRPEEEESFWRTRDPIAGFKSYLLDPSLSTEETLSQVEAEASRRIDEAVAFAVDAPLEEPTEALERVYASA